MLLHHIRRIKEEDSRNLLLLLSHTGPGAVCNAALPCQPGSRELRATLMLLPAGGPNWRPATMLWRPSKILQQHMPSTRLATQPAAAV